MKSVVLSRVVYMIEYIIDIIGWLSKLSIIRCDEFVGRVKASCPCHLFLRTRNHQKNIILFEVFGKDFSISSSGGNWKRAYWQNQIFLRCHIQPIQIENRPYIFLVNSVSTLCTKLNSSLGFQNLSNSLSKIAPIVKWSSVKYLARILEAFLNLVIVNSTSHCSRAI